MSTPKDILLSENAAAQAELLLNLLSDAAAGRELTSVVSDVVQVRSSWFSTALSGAGC